MKNVNSNSLFQNVGKGILYIGGTFFTGKNIFYLGFILYYIYRKNRHLRLNKNKDCNTTNSTKMDDSINEIPEEILEKIVIKIKNKVLLLIASAYDKHKHLKSIEIHNESDINTLTTDESLKLKENNEKKNENKSKNTINCKKFSNSQLKL